MVGRRREITGKPAEAGFLFRLSIVIKDKDKYNHRQFCRFFIAEEFPPAED